MTPTETQLLKQGPEGHMRSMPLLWSDPLPSMQVESREAGVRLYIVHDGQEFAIRDKDPIGFT